MTATIHKIRPCPPPGFVGSAHSPPSQWRENGYSGGHGYCERSYRGEWDIYTYASRQFSKLGEGDAVLIRTDR